MSLDLHSVLVSVQTLQALQYWDLLNAMLRICSSKSYILNQDKLLFLHAPHLQAYLELMLETHVQEDTHIMIKSQMQFGPCCRLSHVHMICHNAWNVQIVNKGGSPL